MGVAAWTVVARAHQRGDHRISSGALMAGCMAASAALALAIAHLRSSGPALQASLTLFGFVYGVTDTAAMQLSLWAAGGASARDQRTAVSTVSAGFTVGAVMMPVLTATSLAFGGDAYASFDVRRGRC